MTKKHETEKQADKYDKAASTLKGAPEPDYYHINYLERGAPEAPWGAHVALFPTREEADAKADSLNAGGALSVRVTPRYWDAK